jgi:hypothetical protein
MEPSQDRIGAQAVSAGPVTSAPALPFCGDFDMRIARDGTWYYRNSPIGRHELVRLFSTVLRREADGSYWLVTPVERGRIEVEDAPFVAVELESEGEGRARRIRLRTNVDRWVTAGPDHPIRVEISPGTGEPRPYILVGNRLEALILRSVFYHLIELGEFEGEGAEARFGVWSDGVFFTLGHSADDLT